MTKTLSQKLDKNLCSGARCVYEKTCQKLLHWQSLCKFSLTGTNKCFLSNKMSAQSMRFREAITSHTYNSLKVCCIHIVSVMNLFASLIFAQTLNITYDSQQFILLDFRSVSKRAPVNVPVYMHEHMPLSYTWNDYLHRHMVSSIHFSFVKRTAYTQFQAKFSSWYAKSLEKSAAYAWKYGTGQCDEIVSRIYAK